MIRRIEGTQREGERNLGVNRRSDTHYLLNLVCVDTKLAGVRCMNRDVPLTVQAHRSSQGDQLPRPGVQAYMLAWLARSSKTSGCIDSGQSRSGQAAYALNQLLAVSTPGVSLHCACPARTCARCK